MKEILVLCPFGVDKGLLSKAARLSGGELRALVPAGEAETAAEYGASRIFELNAPEIGDESAFAAFLSETGQSDRSGSGDGADAEYYAHACVAAGRGTDGGLHRPAYGGGAADSDPSGIWKFPDGGHPLFE